MYIGWTIYKLRWTYMLKMEKNRSIKKPLPIWWWLLWLSFWSSEVRKWRLPWPLPRKLSINEDREQKNQNNFKSHDDCSFAWCLETGLLNCQLPEPVAWGTAGRNALGVVKSVRRRWRARRGGEASRTPLARLLDDMMRRWEFSLPAVH